MFLIDKYRPKVIDDFIFNRNVVEQLLFLSRDNSIPHIIIYGPVGAGKKSLVRFFLEALYDSSINRTDKTTYVVTGSSNTPTEIQIPQSDYHIVIDPTNTNFDKYIIQDVVTQYAIYRPLNFFQTKKVFKTILINNIDNLSYHAQASLRRTMELYAESCRFIMICNNLSKILDPLKSRCVVLRVPLPTNDDILKTIININQSESSLNMDMKKLHEIVKNSNRSIKKAIWLLENSKQNIKSEICLDEVIDNIIETILKSDEHNLIAQINKIRDKNYNILITNIKGSHIICMILDKLLESITDDRIKVNIIKLAANAEFNLIHGRREIMHLDYFIIGTIRELILAKTKV
jgi:replication factor C subunit 3/5